MQAFETHQGVGVPLRRSNVDTDQIVAAQFLKRITRSGYDDALFHAWRQDAGFVLNQGAFRRGTVLVAGSNFGTGSSREHAVWALMDYGFDAIIAPSFGFRVVLSASFADIFRGNAGKSGLLAGQCRHADIEHLWAILEERPGTEVEVDLVHRTVVADTFRCGFDIDEYTRWRLLEGLDDIALSLRHTDAIAAYERARDAWLPTTAPVKG